jgi:hypothetical protein
MITLERYYELREQSRLMRESPYLPCDLQYPTFEDHHPTSPASLATATCGRSRGDQKSPVLAKRSLESLRMGILIRSMFGRGGFCRQIYCRVQIGLLNPPLPFADLLNPRSLGVLIRFIF